MTGPLDDRARADDRAREADHARAKDRAREKAERRAFIRAQHPDAGGDPEQFITGLARFDESPPPQQIVRVHVQRSRRPDQLLRQSLHTFRRRMAGHPPRDLK